MKNNWTKSLAWVRLDEGGNDDDPSDHGGRTSRGITQREYNAWCDENKLPRGDIWHAPEEHIDSIYHDEYWLQQCDPLPSGADYIFFDMKVNSGQHEATILLQRALGVMDDGRIGPVTRQALARADLKELITLYSQKKRLFYRGLATRPSQRKFLRGWLNRCDSVQHRALTLVGATS